ncbi:MAG TPA: response regulator transcription factor [Acidimicrobiia bacterium]|nr:response regulator transcription factor [Acidimicrobiia bacterium]
MSARVLVVEDDPTVAEVVVRYLEREGYLTETVGDGLAALASATAAPPALVILDLMLPGMDGLEVCRQLRTFAPVPVVILTARGEEDDRIMGLELGADDYVSKPFSPRELIARVNAVLRRTTAQVVADSTAVIDVGTVSIDLGAREVRTRDGVVALTAREFDLLSFLARHPRRAFRREELFEAVWGYTYGDTATVTVHIRRLREKIEPNPSTPQLITTVWGVGYRFDPLEAA